VSVPVRDFLKASRDRALGSILGHLEQRVWERLATGERAAVRQVVVDALNGYHERCLDLLKSEDGMRNDEVVVLLRQLDDLVRSPRRRG